MMTRLDQRTTGRRRFPMWFHSAHCPICTRNSGTLALKQCCVFSGGILPAGVDPITRADIKRVISNCTICERFGSKPLRTRAAIPSDVKFNESVYIDVFYIDGDPVLSSVCAGTRYTAAGCMVSKSTADIWDTLQRIWTLPLADCPLNIRLDSASEQMSDEMSGLASGCGIELQFSTVEAH
jgi:hypothetical protein